MDPGLDAADILRQMTQKYARCHSYQDEGIVRSAGGDMRFKTYFIRPDRFRLEWQPGVMGVTNSFLFHALWSNADGICDYSFGRTRNLDTLQRAISINAGVSCGASTIVPRFLIPFADRISYSHLAKVRMVPDETNGACFSIVGWWRKEDDTQLWIDRKTFALKRMKTGIGDMVEGPNRFALEMLGKTNPQLKGVTDEVLKKRCRDDAVYTEIAFNEVIPAGVFHAGSQSTF